MSDIVSTMEYTELTHAVQAIKGAILQSQQRALAAINQEQLALYYGIGRFISSNTRIRIGVKVLLKQSASVFAKNCLD